MLELARRSRSGHITNQDKAELVVLWLERHWGHAPKVHWEAFAHKSKVALILTHGKHRLTAEWKVSLADGSCHPANPLARKLSSLAVRLDDAEVARVLPRGWMPKPAASPKPSRRKQPHRRPARSPQVSSPTRAERATPRFEIEGVMQEGNNSQAIIGEGSRNYTVGVGDEVAGYTVESITDSGVVLRGDGRVLNLRVSTGTESRAGASHHRVARPAPPRPTRHPKLEPKPSPPQAQGAVKQQTTPQGGILLKGGWREFPGRNSNGG